MQDGCFRLIGHTGGSVGVSILYSEDPLSISIENSTGCRRRADKPEDNAWTCRNWGSGCQSPISREYCPPQDGHLSFLLPPNPGSSCLDFFSPLILHSCLTRSLSAAVLHNPGVENSTCGNLPRADQEPALLGAAPPRLLQAASDCSPIRVGLKESACTSNMSSQRQR